MDRFISHRTGALSLLAFTALAVNGCAVGPDFERPTPETPADWTSWHGGDASLNDTTLRSAATSEPQQPWWETFDDPILNTLQARALAANPDLKTAALRFAQSRAQRQMTAAQRGLQLSADGGVVRQRQSENGAGTRLIDILAPPNQDALIQALSEPFTLYQGGFDASWELDLWGRVRRSVEAADANVAGAAAALSGVLLSIQAEVARNYFELRGLQDQVRLTRADIAAAEESLELVQARADGGLTSDLDATRQAALLDDLRSRLPQLLDQEAQTINQITLLLGENPGSLRTELEARNEASAARPLPDLTLGIASEVAQRRPDIRQAEAKLHAATAGIGVAVADLYPRIVLGASFGLESTDSGKFGDWGSRQWSVGPSLSIPLFDQGRRRSEITLRKLEQQRAAVAYQQTVLKAWHEIDTALGSYSAQAQRNAQLVQREANSRAAYELAHVRYENGLTSFLDDLDAQRTLLQAQRDRVSSDSQMAIQLVAIYKAIGGNAIERGVASP